MKRKIPSTELTQARGWALRLNSLVERALAEQPGADPDRVRHRIIQLGQSSPRKGSSRSLTRGGGVSTKNKSAHSQTRARHRKRS